MVDYDRSDVSDRTKRVSRESILGHMAEYGILSIEQHKVYTHLLNTGEITKEELTNASARYHSKVRLESLIDLSGN